MRQTGEFWRFVAQLFFAILIMLGCTLTGAVPGLYLDSVIVMVLGVSLGMSLGAGLVVYFVADGA